MGSVISISLIGAGLVILGLMVLWLLMALLVRLTENINERSVTAEPVTEQSGSLSSEHIQKTVAASIAAALLLNKSTSISSEDKTSQHLTAWQSVHRHTQLYGRSRNFQINRIKK